MLVLRTISALHSYILRPPTPWHYKRRWRESDSEVSDSRVREQHTKPCPGSSVLVHAVAWCFGIAARASSLVAE